MLKDELSFVSLVPRNLSPAAMYRTLRSVDLKGMKSDGPQWRREDSFQCWTSMIGQ